MWKTLFIGTMAQVISAPKRVGHPGRRGSAVWDTSDSFLFWMAPVNRGSKEYISEETDVGIPMRSESGAPTSSDMRFGTMGSDEYYTGIELRRQAVVNGDRQ